MATKKKPPQTGEFAYQPLGRKDAAAKRRLLSRPIGHVRVGKGMKVADLVEAMAGMSIQARNVGQCADVLAGMIAGLES